MAESLRIDVLSLDTPSYSTALLLVSTSEEVSIGVGTADWHYIVGQIACDEEA